MSFTSHSNATESPAADAPQQAPPPLFPSSSFHQRAAPPRETYRPPEVQRAAASAEPDEPARAELARKISWRVSSLPEGPDRDLFFKAIGWLANDPSVMVRSTLAQEVRHLLTVPLDAILALAMDEAPSVCLPVLECSPLLSDVDLIQIASADTSFEPLAAIARRRPLSAEVADALIARLDPALIAILLRNPEAMLGERAFERMAEHTDIVAVCLEPFANREELPETVVRCLARVSGPRVLARLAALHWLDPQTRSFLESELGARLEERTRRLRRRRKMFKRRRL